jgi:sterol desaturase/sphingolipid hydroxylase (fatty acid hydroxylase superfamily)
MIAGAAVVAAGAWFLYNPAPDAGLGHLLVWYLAVTLGWTMVEIPHTAMAAELSRDYHERSRVALWRQLLGFVGGVLFMASPMLLLGGTTRFTPDVMRAIAVFIMVGLPLAVLVMPIHPVAFTVFMLWQIFFNVMGHTGYEFYPRWLMDSWLGKFINTPTNHIMHHETLRGNYGLYFNVWDRIMGTNHAQYENRFREVTARSQDPHPRDSRS